MTPAKRVARPRMRAMPIAHSPKTTSVSMMETSDALPARETQKP